MDNKRDERLGLIKTSKHGDIMKVVEYNNSKDMAVEFQDANKAIIHCEWKQFLNGNIKNPYKYKQRLGEEKYNHQNCLMRIIEYNDAKDIVVEFQDEYKAKLRTSYGNFVKGTIGNPYYPSVYNVGMYGVLYPARHNNRMTEEYDAWTKMLQRCYSEKYCKVHKSYEIVTCCDEWLLYENFYEWLHSQDNFNKWLNGERWAIDKDILIKGSKVYSPDTCCLVPQNVNNLFIKADSVRGNYPIGVRITRNGTFQAYCNNPFTNKIEHLGTFSTPEKAFLAYKKAKESYIKQIAQDEYSKGNITKQCYEAMMNYEVEITD